MKNGNEGMSNLVEIENLNKQIEELKKEIELVREDAQVEIMRRDLRISNLEKMDGNAVETLMLSFFRS